MDDLIRDRVLRKYSLDQNKEKVDFPYDLFICSAGYEERTTGFLKSNSGLLTAKNSLIFLYHPEETELYIKNLENLEKMKIMLASVSLVKPVVVELNPIDPWHFRQITNELFEKYSINPSTKVLVDITSFTRVFIYELIKSLYSSGCNFSLVYTEPESYVETMAAGVDQLVISPSFAGKPRTNNKSFLLLFLGWETGRSQETFESFNSDDHIGVIGVQPIDEKHIFWQFQSYKKNKALMRNITNILTCPTLELDLIYQFIDKIYTTKMNEFRKRRERFDFAISGFGPKIQNIAIAFFALNHKDTQLVYGAPSYWGASSDTQTGIPIESQGIGSSFIYGPFSNEIIDSQLREK